MQAVYTLHDSYIRPEEGDSLPAFTAFECSTVWFADRSRRDRRLMTIEDYVLLVGRMSDQELLQSCRNRKLETTGDPEDMKAVLLAFINPEPVEEPVVGNIDLTQLPESDKLSFRDLQRLLKDAGLSAAGTYDELVERLKEVEVEA